MIINDDNFPTEVRRAWPDNGESRAPAFDATWRAAESRYARARHIQRMLAGAAAAVAAIIVGLNLTNSPVDDVTYIEVAELLESTSWTAPSDVLLPKREFDIYQELPTLLESTETAGGTLL